MQLLLPAAMCRWGGMVGNMLSSMKKADPSSPLSDFSNNDELDKVDHCPGLLPWCCCMNHPHLHPQPGR